MILYLSDCIKEGSEDLEQELRDIIENHMKRISKDLERSGYNEIEFQLSDECLKEDLEENEVDFLESGKRSFYV